MGTVKTFEDLLIWQKSIELTKLIYKITSKFPYEEKFALADQLKRACISVPSNIAEGYGRRTAVDYRRFLTIALGSVYEIQTQLRIGLELNFISSDLYHEAKALSKEIGIMIYTIIKKLI